MGSFCVMHLKLRTWKNVLTSYGYSSVSRILIAFLLASVFCLPLNLTAGDGQVTLIHIGDLHGHLVPRPQMRDATSDHGRMVGGLAYVYDQISKIRRAHRNNLLINTGDTIQGSAEALFSRGMALIDILNEFKIDAFVPGNWDFIYGTDHFIRLFAGKTPKANWHAIAANLYYATLYEFPATPYAEKAGQRVLPPYLIYKLGDVKVGLIGLTAERGPKALSPIVMEGFYLTTGQDELPDAIDLLRNKEQVDLVVLLSERGLSNNLELVETFPGVDIVLSSDMHEETHKALVAESGTILVEEGQDGTLVGELSVRIEKKKITDWTWQAHRISIDNNIPHPKIARKIETIRRSFVKGDFFKPHVNPINGAVLRTPIDTVIGHTRIPLHRSNFSDAEKAPAVIEGTSHNFLTDAFKVACQADVGVIRGFRYGTHIAPGQIRLEDIYHYIPIGPQIACGLMSGDNLKLQIERSSQAVLSQWVGTWGGGWLPAFSGLTYTLDPYNEFGFRASRIRVNGELIDHEKMYQVAGYWYVDEPSHINRNSALEIKVLRDRKGGIVDATEVVAYYLQILPGHVVTPSLGRVKLLKPLPKPVWKNKEIQPLKGAIRVDYGAD